MRLMNLSFNLYGIIFLIALFVPSVKMLFSTPGTVSRVAAAIVIFPKGMRNAFVWLILGFFLACLGTMLGMIDHKYSEEKEKQAVVSGDVEPGPPLEENPFEPVHGYRYMYYDRYQCVPDDPRWPCPEWVTEMSVDEALFDVK